MNKVKTNPESNVIDVIVADLFKTFRLEYKKLIKVDFSAIRPGLSLLHFLVLRTLSEAGSLPISEIGKRLLVPGPQMTHLADQLIKMELVVRIPDSNDRRIIRMQMTGEGEIVLTKCRALLRKNVKKKLSYLKNEELKDLSILLRGLGEILAGME